MKRVAEILQFVRDIFQRYVSTAFVVLFCASFILWYVMKLGDTYVTEYDILVEVDGKEVRVPCVIEAVGTDLLDFRQYTRHSMHIPLGDLVYSVKHMTIDGVSQKYYVIEPHSMQRAISVRLKEAKDVSVGSIPPIEVPNQ